MFLEAKLRVRVPAMQLLLLLLSDIFQTAKGIQINNSRSAITMNAGLTNMSRRSIGKLRPEGTVFLLCDIQERFRSITWRGETIIGTANYMTSVAKTLDIPVVVTQQYTKVFGETVPDTFADQDHFQSCKRFEKKRFSMCTDEVKSHLSALNKSSVVLFGIEAHVCVQQTCLDLLEEGIDVHLIADGISSQQPYDRDIALQRMSNAGAFLTTAQSTAFMLMQSAEHTNFKAVSKLTVEHMKRPNEFNDAITGSDEK
mmetsp:Transcript_19209/g.39520  ORF Transcript_19209/g.39520 Transcript_19209/m.39520 type:complete len:256 (-) Transcript_19209:1033-1800(-)